MKKVRTIRIDKGVSDKLDSICTRHGDISWHIEQALKHYMGKHYVAETKEKQA
jgi:predicted transcriptional regulator